VVSLLFVLRTTNVLNADFATPLATLKRLCIPYTNKFWWETKNSGKRNRQNEPERASLWVMHEPHTFTEQMTICVQRLTESGVAALNGLFDLSSQRLVRYATTITRNQHDAEDAVQATMVLVAKNLRRFCQSEQPWPYLLRIVRNESLLIARRKKRWTLSGNLTDLFTRRLVDEVEMEETFRAVWGALRSLPTEQAEVVVLKIWEEMTFAQMAAVLEVSSNTVASRYRYAMQKLAQKLDPAKERDSAEGRAQSV